MFVLGGNQGETYLSNILDYIDDFAIPPIHLFYLVPFFSIFYRSVFIFLSKDNYIAYMRYKLFLERKSTLHTNYSI